MRCQTQGSPKLVACTINSKVKHNHIVLKVQSLLSLQAEILTLYLMKLVSGSWVQEVERPALRRSKSPAAWITS